MSLFEELKRRNVFRVSIAYVVMAWLVLQVADVVLNNIEAPDWIFHVLLLFLAIGLPFAVFFAWAFELTPEGLKREHEVDRSQSITHHTGRKLDFMIIGVLVLALGYFVYDKFVLDAQRDTALVEATTQALSEQSENAEPADELSNSIAVLPFLNMSSEEEQEYFSDGLSEELLNLLAKIPQLRVTARTSSFAFKETDTPIREIARQLNVGHVLEGSVRKSGDRVRITAQLIAAGTETHLWSETWDRTLDDVFAIQDEIAAQVVEQLKITLLGETPHVQAVDPQAYALFLQARHLGHQYSNEAFLQSNALYQQALSIDPEYSAAWAGLAANYHSMDVFAISPLVDSKARAIEAVEKALSIDPDLALAHAVMGRMTTSYDNDLVQTARHFRRALQLDSADMDTIRSSASFLARIGRLDEAITANEWVVVRDPLNPAGFFNLGVSYYYAGRWDAAIASFETVQRLSPDRTGTHHAIGMALLFKGETEAALESYIREADEEYRVKGQSLALFALGRMEEHQAKLDELIERWGDRWPSEVAQVYSFKGDADHAFEWLDRAIEHNEAGLTDQFLLPYYRPLHSDPRWQAFLERVGSAPEQLDAIEFEVTLPGH